ncbi:MAG: hypothetical protein QOC70_1536 [Verrucomicrobiota bacterium]|jgi:hypothetical protein
MTCSSQSARGSTSGKAWTDSTRKPLLDAYGEVDCELLLVRPVLVSCSVVLVVSALMRGAGAALVMPTVT